MEIRIGVTYTPKEISLELADGVDAADIRSKVDDALNGTSAVLWLEDRKGRQIAVPAEKISYVEIGSEEGDRPIGFG